MPDVIKCYEGRPETPYKAWVFFCPGCNREHPYRVVADGHTEAEVRATFPNGCWSFNGNTERPTFTPSLLCDASHPEYRCHLFVTDGKIRYCDDCHHELRGQTVDMIPVDSWPEYYS